MDEFELSSYSDSILFNSALIHGIKGYTPPCNVEEHASTTLRLMKSIFDGSPTLRFALRKALENAETSNLPDYYRRCAACILREIGIPRNEGIEDCLRSLGAYPESTDEIEEMGRYHDPLCGTVAMLIKYERNECRHSAEDEPVIER